MAFTFSYYFNAFLNLKRAEIIKIRIRPNETLLLDVIPVLGKILFFELIFFYLHIFSSFFDILFN